MQLYHYLVKVENRDDNGAGWMRGGLKLIEHPTREIYDGSCSSSPDDSSHGVLIVGYGSEGDDDY
ncbi:hypothetical protein KY285_030065 [Solanum tuberosum]|nr:hypothetical protein KY285_030065 [Solanum tuberosum]